MKTLEQKTRQYWFLSLACRGSPGRRCNLTVGDAISELSGVLSVVSPLRPLSRASGQLMHRMIIGEPHANKRAR